MTLPPLYKYLSVRGAKLTLGNRSFKHAKPSDFNDTEDLTIQSIFTEDAEEALKKIAGGFADAILSNVDRVPTCDSPMKEKVMLIQQALRVKPGIAEKMRTDLKSYGEQVEVIEYYREKAKAHVAEINQFMQGYRVLCVSTHLDSERMWDEYAEQHKGIALRIQPNLAKDSKFQLFRPVAYQEKRPSLYEDTQEFIVESLFGDHEARIKKSIDQIIYTKSMEWQHEREYRLAIPLRQDEAPWDTLPYHSEEITELYLGQEMEGSDKSEIVEMARIINSTISIFQAKCGVGGKFVFERVGG